MRLNDYRGEYPGRIYKDCQDIGKDQSYWNCYDLMQMIIWQFDHQIAKHQKTQDHKVKPWARFVDDNIKVAVIISIIRNVKRAWTCQQSNKSVCRFKQESQMVVVGNRIKEFQQDKKPHCDQIIWNILVFLHYIKFAGLENRSNEIYLKNSLGVLISINMYKTASRCTVIL